MEVELRKERGKEREGKGKREREGERAREREELRLFWCAGSSSCWVQFTSRSFVRKSAQDNMSIEKEETRRKREPKKRERGLSFFPSSSLSRSRGRTNFRHKLERKGDSKRFLRSFLPQSFALSPRIRA